LSGLQESSPSQGNTKLGPMGQDFLLKRILCEIGVRITGIGLGLDQPASAYPVACYGVRERNKIGRIPYWEDSPQLAAGYASIG
jgi:hypothetical protein